MIKVDFFPFEIPEPGDAVDPYLIYSQARAYADTERILCSVMLDTGLTQLVFPGFVLGVFSVELMLKAIYHDDNPGKDYIYEHNPKALFEKLLPTTRGVVETKYSQLISAASGEELKGLMTDPPTTLDLPSVLGRAHSLFMRARYIYEGIEWTEVSGTSGNVGLNHLRAAVQNVLEVRHPDWHPIYMAQTLPAAPRSAHLGGKLNPHASFIERQYRALGRL